MPLSVAFLCSGGGGNLKLLHSLVSRGALPSVFVSSVIADRECAALDWARSQKIQSRVVAYSRTQPESLSRALADFSPDLIVTTIHKILDEALVARYAGRLLNLHYSLLPAFAGTIGMKSVELARAQGCRLIGATAHRVTADLDAGPIVAQACVADDPQLPEAKLHDSVFRCGGVALAAGLESLVNPDARREGGPVQAGDLSIFAAPIPPPAVCDALRDQAFWTSLR